MRRRQGIPLRRTLVAIAFAAASLVAPSPAAADHSTTSYPTHMQWNMCGWRCHTGSTGPSTALVNSIISSSRQNPTVVSVNEICSAQLYDMTNRLGVTYRYNYIVTVDFPNTSTYANCEWFGNAVFWRNGQHADGNVEDHFDIQGFYDQQKLYPETRGYTCGKSLQSVLQGCSSHLTPDNVNTGDTNEPVKKKQLVQYTDWVSFADACCAPSVMLGDFNLVPVDIMAFDSRPYGNMHEADELGAQINRTTMDSTTGPHIDYIFVPYDTHYIAHDAYIFTSSYSDHRVVVGYWKSR